MHKGSIEKVTSFLDICEPTSGSTLSCSIDLRKRSHSDAWFDRFDNNDRTESDLWFDHCESLRARTASLSALVLDTTTNDLTLSEVKPGSVSTEISEGGMSHQPSFGDDYDEEGTDEYIEVSVLRGLQEEELQEIRTVRRREPEKEYVWGNPTPPPSNITSQTEPHFGKVDYLSWNEQFQNALLNKDCQSALEVLRRFQEQVVKVVVSIVDNGKVLTKEEIGGTGGGSKFIQDGVFYKYVDERMARLYGSRNSAGKTYSAEIRAIRSVLDCGLPVVWIPPTILVTYKGFRMLASALVPIKRHTLIYGSDDVGVRIRTKMLGRRITQELAARLNLALHWARGKDNLQARLFTPLDTEGHHSDKDGRFYLIDLARLFPRFPSCRQKCCFLRPELVKMSPSPLSSDSFTRFSENLPHSRQHDSAAEAAIVSIQKKYAHQCVDELIKLSPLDGQVIKDVLHSKGINLRFMGMIANICHQKSLTNELHAMEAEILSRSIKKYIYAKLPSKNLKKKDLDGYELKTDSFISSNVSENDNPNVSLDEAACRAFQSIEHQDFWPKLLSIVATKFGYTHAINRESHDMNAILKRVEVLTGMSYNSTQNKIKAVPVVKGCLSDKFLTIHKRMKATDLQRVLHVQEASIGCWHGQLIPTLLALARAHIDASEKDEAAASLQRVFQICQVLESQTHPTQTQIHQMGVWLSEVGDILSAGYSMETVKTTVKTRKVSSPSQIRSQITKLVDILEQGGRHEEAAALKGKSSQCSIQ